MNSLFLFYKYLFAKILTKLNPPAILGSAIHITSKVQSGSHINYSRFGHYSYCGSYCMFNYAHIGSFCSIADRVHIGGSAHPIDFVSTSPVFLSHSRTSVKKKFHDHIFLPKKITTIGNDVWIGSGVFIKGGLKIGNGAIIGMGSVVTKDVPDYAIVAGNPAKIIRMRFPDHLINKMLELKWWDWDDSKLLEYGKYFNNPIDLINKVSKK